MVAVFILGVVVGVVIIFILLKNFNSFICNSSENNIQKEKKPTDNKDDNKEKILRFMAFRNMQGDNVANDDVEKLLNVSDSTATRYLQELKEERKVRQVGEKGGYIYYEIT